MTDKQIKAIVQLILLSVLLPVSGCFSDFDTLVDPTAVFMTEERLWNNEDLPPGWRVEFTRTRSREEPDAIFAYYREFEYGDETYDRVLNLDQHVWLYPDASIALEAYEDIKRNRPHGDAWYTPLDFSYHPTANEYSLTCLDLRVNEVAVTACNMLIVYEDILYQIYFVVDGDKFKFADVEQLLARLDEQFSSASP